MVIACIRWLFSHRNQRQMVAQASQFSLRDVEVITSTIDLDDIWSARQSRSRGMQAMKAHEFKRVKIDFAMTQKSQSNLNLRIAKND